MYFVDEMIDFIEGLFDYKLKIKFGGSIKIISANNFKSDVYIFRLHKKKKAKRYVGNYFSVVKKIYKNIENIGLRFNIVFNFFAYDNLRPYIAFGVGDDILHEDNVVEVYGILYGVGFSDDVTIIDVIRNIKYDVIWINI